MAAAKLINHSEPLPTSEVGLTSHHTMPAQGLWSRFVPPTGTIGLRFPPFGLPKRDLWSRFVALTGTIGGHWYRLVPRTGTIGIAI